MQRLLVQGEPKLVDFLAESKLASSRSEARRLIEQKGVRLDGQAVSDANARLELAGQAVLQVGKRKIVRLTRE